MSYKDQIESMTFSFSRINGYRQCPYMWCCQYIEKLEAVDNFYAQAGSLMHDILASVLTGKLNLSDAAEEFLLRFDTECDMPVSDKIRESTLEKMCTYLTEVPDNILDGYEVLSVEERVEFTVGTHSFCGYIDLLLKDKSTGDLVLCDHKSDAYPLLKSGRVAKGMENRFLEHKRQLYLYAVAVAEKYGKFPKVLAWNHFKDRRVCSIPFDENEFKMALEWATQTIDEIKNDEQFEPKKDYFFCHNLCGFRYDCEYLMFDNEEEGG